MGSIRLDDLPREVRLGKHVLMCSPMRVEHISALRRRIADQKPDPIAAVKGRLEELGDEYRDIILRACYEDLKRQDRVSDAEVDMYANTLEGTIYTLFLCARECRPLLSLEEVEEMYNDMSVDDMEKFAETLFKAVGPRRPTKPSSPPRTTTAMRKKLRERNGKKSTSTSSKKRAGRRSSSVG